MLVNLKQFQQLVTLIFASYLGTHKLNSIHILHFILLKSEGATSLNPMTYLKYDMIYDMAYAVDVGSPCSLNY